MKYISIILLFAFFSLNLNAQKKFYVSPQGSDLNSGTKEQPLASLTGARDAIRNYKKNNTSSISFTVIIADGIYTMKQPLELTQEDSGTALHPVTYIAEEGATPVFSGGKIINNLKVNKNGIWETEIFESKYYKWRFDQLYINNKRATMAKTPNDGFLTIGEVQETIWKKGTGPIPKKAQQILSFNATNFSTLSNLSNEDLKLIRFRTYHKWDSSIKYFDDIDKRKLSVTTSGSGLRSYNPIKKDGRIIFENYKGALDAPGEWFLDANGTLLYIPLPGETIENTEIIAPVLEHLLIIKGDITNNSLAQHIHFKGLTFKHSHHQIPKNGLEPHQAVTRINAAIMVTGAENISFSNCEISDIGQHAIWFGKGCSNASVNQCYINNIGGGGIYLGDVTPQKGLAHTHHIKLDNNIIQSGGQEFPAAVGIWVGHSSDNEITHNDIGNFYYTGISLGWVWNYKTSLAKRNKVLFNKIHHIGWDLLSDLGGVYTLGSSEGTEISNNVIHDIHAHSYGGWGLYTDQASSHIIMENNLVYNTKTGGFHQHYGKNNTIKNNIFAFAKKYQLQCSRVEKHRSFNFSNNIVVFKEGDLLDGTWNKIDIKMDNNLYWNTKRNSYNFNGNSFRKWKKLGRDKNSIIKNPNFIDANNFNFTLKNTKNTRRINFEPFDYSKAGVYGSTDWINKSKLSNQILVAFDKAVKMNMKNE